VVKRRWIKISLAAVGACAVCGYLALPTLVGHHLRSELADRGFPDARLEVASIGLHQLKLRDVHLKDGLDLGTVSVNGGVSLLWRDADQVTVDGANVDVDAVKDIRRNRSSKNRSLPFKTIHVAGSTIQLGSHAGDVDGTLSADQGALDISLSVRDPGKRGWSAKGTGRVTWGEDVTLAGQVDIAVPHYKAGPFTVTDIQVPATIDARGVHVTNATAKVAGGELSLDGFVATGKAPDVVLRARGIRLSDLLGPSKRMTGTGLVDGGVALRADREGVWIQRGEFHARTPGTLQITDGKTRDKIAAMKGPFSLRATLGAALTDFRYDTLTAELSAPGRGAELRVATKGRGRKNKQELDIAVGVRGVRDVSARVLGGTQR